MLKYLIDIGSSTIKVYTKQEYKVSLVKTKSFSFKDGFSPSSGLSDSNKELLYRFFEELVECYSLNRCNTKIYATGIFRDIQNKQSFIEEFYTRTRFFFNIIAHDLEAFYLEKACIGACSYNGPILIINIGGKTTELLFYNNGSIVGRELLSIGVGTILNAFPLINSDHSSVSLEEIVAFVVTQLPKNDLPYTTAVYTGGELTYMRTVGYPLTKNTTFEDSNHPMMIMANDYYDHNQQIFSRICLSELRQLMPGNPSWMDGARGCSAIAQAICIHYGVRIIIPSDSNMVDGINIQEAKSVVICGSFNKHLVAISKLIDRLKKQGIKVLSPRNTDIVGSEKGFLLFKDDNVVNHCTWSVESFHLQAIEECDFIIVCNFDSYIGTKTALEIGYAYKCGKKIVFFEENSIIDDFDIPSEIELL